jgi:hypothetical protein
MTPAELFRSSDVLRSDLRTLLESDTFNRARAIIESVARGKDAPLDAPEIYSVRLLSTRSARESVFDELEELTQPLPQQSSEQMDDFGFPKEAALSELPEPYIGPQ